jgi:hypothetical protein
MGSKAYACYMRAVNRLSARPALNEPIDHTCPSAPSVMMLSLISAFSLCDHTSGLFGQSVR